MRTLKKTLALVLVVAMVLSFGVIGASADFTDVKADNDYKEAIDVLSGIGVINGMTSTTFEPDGSLTRAQAAKIIAYMLLGPTNAELISTATKQTFTDVATSHWAAGYIEYCANLGIINGVGDGKFDPEAKLTSAAFTKMLLVALGYNPTTEKLVGESWAINVATLAVGAGITDKGISVSASTVVNRGQAAQLAFKTLTANMVNYVGGSEITVGDTTIIQGATRTPVSNLSSEYRTNYTTAVNIITTNQDNVMQFCESKFPTLKLNPADTDASGRTTRTWRLGATTIGSYAVTDSIARWTEDHKTSPSDNTVINALRGYTYAAGLVATVNGATSITTVANAQNVEDLTGNGTIVEVYATGTVIDRVVVVTPLLATVSGKSSTTVTLSITGGDTATVTATNALSDYYNTLPALSLRDQVMVAGVDSDNNSTYDSLVYIGNVSTVSGTFTGISGTNRTIGGTSYGINTTANAAVSNVLKADNLGSDYTLTLDAFGYIVKTDEGATSTSSYAYVLGATVEGSVVNNSRSHYVHLLFTDGHTEWVALGSVNGRTSEAELNAYVSGYAAGNFVTYSSGTNGYAINDVNSDLEKKDSDGLTITRNTPAVNIGGTNYTLTNSTVFLMYNSRTEAYTVYTGITNVPNITVANGTNVYAAVAVNAANAAVRVLVVTDGANTGNDVVAVYSNAIDTSYEDGHPVYTYRALVNGELSTIKSQVVYSKGDVLTSYSTNSNGVIISGTKVSTNSLTQNVSFTAKGTLNFAVSATGTTQLSSGILTIEDGSSHTASGLTVGSDFNYFVVDISEGTCLLTSISSTAMATGAAGEMYIVADDNGFASYAIYVVA